MSIFDTSHLSFMVEKPFQKISTGPQVTKPNTRTRAAAMRDYAAELTPLSETDNDTSAENKPRKPNNGTKKRPKNLYCRGVMWILGLFLFFVFLPLYLLTRWNANAEAILNTALDWDSFNLTYPLVDEVRGLLKNETDIFDQAIFLTHSSYKVRYRTEPAPKPGKAGHLSSNWNGAPLWQGDIFGEESYQLLHELCYRLRNYHPPAADSFANASYTAESQDHLEALCSSGQEILSEGFQASAELYPRLLVRALHLSDRATGVGCHFKDFVNSGYVEEKDRHPQEEIAQPPKEPLPQRLALFRCDRMWDRQTSNSTDEQLTIDSGENDYQHQALDARSMTRWALRVTRKQLIWDLNHPPYTLDKTILLLTRVRLSAVNMVSVVDGLSSWADASLESARLQQTALCGDHPHSNMSFYPICRPSFDSRTQRLQSKLSDLTERKKHFATVSQQAAELTARTIALKAGWQQFDKELDFFLYHNLETAEMLRDRDGKVISDEPIVIPWITDPLEDMHSPLYAAGFSLRFESWQSAEELEYLIQDDIKSCQGFKSCLRRTPRLVLQDNDNWKLRETEDRLEPFRYYKDWA